MARPEPSAEDIAALLSHLEQNGGNLNDPSLSSDLQELLRNVKRSSGQPVDDVPTEEILPEPGFVAKTSDKDGRKVFINVCHSSKVASPGGWTNNTVPLDVKEALKNADALSADNCEALRFPLSAGDPRPDVDWKGEPCTTVDVVFSTEVIKQAGTYRPLKSFLVQLAMGWVSQKHKLDLCDEYKLPKLQYKGEKVQLQRVKIDRKPLVTEVKEVFEDPEFPLIINKEVASGVQGRKQQQQQQQQQGVAPDASVRDQSKQVLLDTQQLCSARGGNECQQTGKKAVGLIPLEHKVEYHGRPVQRMTITVQLPSSLVVRPETVQVTTSGHVVGIHVAGAEPVTAELHFAVDHAQSRARLQTGQIVVELFYMAVDNYVKFMRSQTPHSFGSLKLGTASCLDLEP